MRAIAFDLVVAETGRLHPKSFSQAYADIGTRLGEFGFNRVQGSVYVSESEDLANLSLPSWLSKLCRGCRPSVSDIRAFRVEQWSDFTKLVKT